MTSMPCLQQAVGGFQAEQPAADHHRLGVAAGRRQHGLDVGDVAETDHTLFVRARQRDDERVGTGGQQQPVIGPW